MKSIGESLQKAQEKIRPKNISKEFQAYGIYLADQLQDEKHYSLYIKLAKTYPRQILDSALSYVKDYPNPKSKPKLFMWRIKQLKNPALTN